MTTFTVIERPQKLEPVAKDPFIEGLPSGGAEDTVRDTLVWPNPSEGTAAHDRARRQSHLKPRGRAGEP
jgi:hypothetical protein